MRRRTVALAAAGPAGGDDKIDSLQRGLEVLRCFQPGEGLLAVADIARRLALPKPTTRRLLDTLAQHGFVLRSPGGESYGLHVASFVVGQAVLNGSPMVRQAQPLLQGLADRFAAHALLCVGDRRDMLVLAHRAAPGAPAWSVGAGLRLPIADTAVGHAWLWAQPATVQSAWMAHLREAGSGGAAEVWKAFHTIEASGTCESVRPERRQSLLLAAPVVWRDGATAVLACACGADAEAAAQLRPEVSRALVEAAAVLRDQVGRSGA
ncbi:MULTISPECIES: IclR family transcriptional regulator [Ramlibacter]|uniref:Helix-turn-helix domain-containing protein n=1 Tax=Ramlibacter pinisoli TaxID=2682844 RepID=A0A6N8IV94_9BURK|nr:MULTISPECIES: helix-turn-helix domain-containing protein [Ramlibacter]MBA2965519.1 helix-turn-helix domain-containing protein [Ramlibacter sp. CGMCC 1.13660]MVQ30485.1 helix-turn-helix domain-containing protein [Ramlibacter pinisoli]